MVQLGGVCECWTAEDAWKIFHVALLSFAMHRSKDPQGLLQSLVGRSLQGLHAGGGACPQGHALGRPTALESLKDRFLSIHDGIWICTFALNQFGDDLGRLC